MDFRQLLTFFEQSGGLVTTLGITFEERGDAVTCSMPIEPTHEGAPGISHGGAVMALLDTALGVRALMHSVPMGQGTSTVEMKVNFLRPVRAGSTLVTETTIQSAGKSLLVISGAAFNKETDEQVAFAVGTFNLYPSEKVQHGVKRALEALDV
jgi:uncharacterized protein (TIGR00369 family)